MNELMKKIVEKLSVSIDKIPEVYTGLRNQYVVWEMCDSMSWILGIAALCATFALIFIGIDTDWEWENESKRLRKIKKIQVQKIT